MSDIGAGLIVGGIVGSFFAAMAAAVQANAVAAVILLSSIALIVVGWRL